MGRKVDVSSTCQNTKIYENFDKLEKEQLKQFQMHPGQPPWYERMHGGPGRLM